MANKIESLTLTIGQTFSENYVIPRYQREFVWTEKEVTRLLRDIYESYSVDNYSEYFIGSTVVCKNESGLYDIIDGQQRLTTMFIIICCIRDIIESQQPEGAGFVKGLISVTDNDTEGNPVYRYRVELQYPDSRDALKNIADGGLDTVEILAGTRSVRNIYNAYEVVKSLILMTG